MFDSFSRHDRVSIWLKMTEPFRNDSEFNEYSLIRFEIFPLYLENDDENLIERHKNDRNQSNDLLLVSFFIDVVKVFPSINIDLELLPLSDRLF